MRCLSFRLRPAHCLLGFLMTALSACKPEPEKQARVIVIQPFDDFPAAQTDRILKQIKAINPATLLRAPTGLPEAAYYPTRKRYRADVLLAFLKQTAGGDTTVIGLTTKDISTTKGKVADWGIMGLAYQPGNACVVSSFRLSPESGASQFYKVAVHELGHTQGLPHCPNAACYMRDAEGGNPTDKETGFCKTCKTFLRQKGWRLKG